MKLIKDKDKFAESMAYYAFIFIIYAILIVFGIFIAKKAIEVVEEDKQKYEYVEPAANTEGERDL